MSEHCTPHTPHDVRYPESDPRHHPPLCAWHLARGGEVKVQRDPNYVDRRALLLSPSGENAVEIGERVTAITQEHGEIVATFPVVTGEMKPVPPHGYRRHWYPFAGELYLTTIRSDDYAEPGDFATGARGFDTDNVDVPVERADVATSLIRDSVEMERLRTHDGVESVREVVADEGRHHILIDLDVEAHLLPSSTPGHSHLYIRANTEWENIEKLLDALVACGVVEEGYASASKHRRRTRLRLPWVKKEGASHD